METTDVDIICKRDTSCIQAVFKQHEKLSKRSGLQLNAEKTEILHHNSNTILNFDVAYLGRNVNISTIVSVKICGIWYCNDKNVEYKLNILP